jgi:hypothetical protein
MFCMEPSFVISSRDVVCLDIICKVAALAWLPVGMFKGGRMAPRLRILFFENDFSEAGGPFQLRVRLVHQPHQSGMDKLRPPVRIRS